MEDKDKFKNENVFISFLDERNRQIEMFVELIHVDSSFVKFKTKEGNRVMIPSCRVLKIKEKGGENG